MERETSTNKHWAIDKPYTDFKDDPADILLAEAIDLEIEKRYGKLQVSNIDDMEFNEPSKEINLPDFSTKYLIQQPKYYAVRTQKWVGHIIELGENFFSAKLDDLTCPGTYEIAEFDFDEVSKEDQQFLGLGSVFYWSVGTSTINGQIKKESIVRFKRVVEWTEENYDNALDRAKFLNDNINWED